MMLGPSTNLTDDQLREALGIVGIHALTEELKRRGWVAIPRANADKIPELAEPLRTGWWPRP